MGKFQLIFAYYLLSVVLTLANIQESQHSLVQGQADDYILKDCQLVDQQCAVCSFDQLRVVKDCQITGYVEQLICTFASSKDPSINYQEYQYRVCEAPNIFIYSWEFIVSMNVILLLLIFYLSLKQEKDKLENLLYLKITGFNKK